MSNHIQSKLVITGNVDIIHILIDEFISLVKSMREAQKDVIYKSMFSTLDSARPTAYEVAKMKQIALEQEVDEYFKKLEEKK